MTYLEEYRQGINSGRFIVCERMAKVINRLADEAQDPESGYIYDTRHAHKRIRWQEKYVKQSKNQYSGKTIKLSVWQKAFIECIYSFKDEKTRKRRFTEVLLLVARKNGKSTLMASNASFGLFCQRGITTGCVSNTDKQAKLVWDEIDSIRSKIDPKSRYTGRNIFEIRCRSLDNAILRMSSTMQNLDGRNFSICIFDEVHECKNQEIYEASIRSMGAVDEPLMIMVTTNGYVRGRFMDEKLAYAHSVADGEIDDKSFLPWLYEQDTEDEIYENHQSWRKSNPGLDDGVKTWRYLEETMQKSEYSLQSKNAMLCKDFNLPQIASSAFLHISDIDQLKDKKLDDLPTYAQRLGRDWVFAVVAVDLSKTSDLTCACFVWQMPDDQTIYCLPHFWIPKAKITGEDNDRNAGADYETWARDGYVEVVDGAEIAGEDVADWIMTTAKEARLYPLHIGYDQWQSKPLVERLEKYWSMKTTEKIGQGYQLSNSMFRLADELHAGNVNVDGNPCMLWCLENLVADTDKNGNVKPIKNSNSSKIDGAVALIMGIQELRDHQQELKDSNRKRGK